MSQDSNTKKPIKKSSVDSPKEQIRNAWLSLGETLQKIVQLQSSLAGLSVQEQKTEAVLLQKLRIYHEAMPELVDVFERLAKPVMAKQAGGRPSKATESSVARNIAVAHFKKYGKDLSAENLSGIAWVGMQKERSILLGLFLSVPRRTVFFTYAFRGHMKNSAQ